MAKYLGVIPAFFILLLFAPCTQAKQYVFSVQSDAHLEFARVLCLEALKAAGMDAEFTAFPIGPENRLNAEMQAGNLHIAFLPQSADRIRMEKEGFARSIRIPLERGLLGYRVCLVSDKTSDILQGVTTAEDLRRFTIGQGLGWGDTAIYRKAGIQVVEAPFTSIVDPLKALAADRFDLLPLGVDEYTRFLTEYAKHATGLTADTHILIRYPWFRFVWVSAAAPDSGALYDALDKGLGILAANGGFEAIYARYRGTFDAKKLKGRTIIDLPSPYARLEDVDARFRRLIVAVP